MDEFGELIQEAEEEVDAYVLARLMLRWRAQREKLDQTEEEIKALVLKAGKTQTVGGVRATFSKGRRTYDYESAAEGAGLDNETWNRLVVAHTKPVTDWRALCEAAEIKEIPCVQASPSVSVKLLK